MKTTTWKATVTLRRFTSGLTVIVCLMGFASQASAVLLTTSSSEFLGLVNDGIPSNEANEVQYINTLIGLTAPSGPTTIGSETYTRSSNTPSGCCFTAVLTGTSGNINSSTGTGIDVTGFEYLLAKYDASNAGSLVWYVGNLTGTQSVQDKFGTCGPPTAPTGCGISHYALFNASGGGPTNEVPEPSALLLLGAGLIALRVTRKRFRRN